MQFVYHGSPDGDIEILKPRVSPGTGEEYGALVYASPSIAAASIFTADVGKSWSAGTVNGILYALIPLTRDEFAKRDKGGFIYTLPGETFSSDLERGMGDLEWASHESVKPIEKRYYPSALEAMLGNGIRVYFVNDETLERFRNTDPKEKGAFLSSLGSENQRRTVNARPVS